MTHISSGRTAGPGERGEYVKVPSAEPEAQLPFVDEQRSARLGVGKMMAFLHHRDTVQVEKASVYGSALAMPQLARSAGWPLNLILLSMRSYLFLVINILLQGVFLFMIDKSEEVMDKFAGQMKLCDFGADVRDCPDGPGCTGPGGTQYSPSRMYGFSHWVTRNFVRDSLTAIFPEKQDQIYALVDPGEFGQESRACRILCCFLFMTSLMSELSTTMEMARMLHRIPTTSSSWVVYDHTTREPRLRIEGMPCFWKFINWIFVFTPKLILWRLTVSAAMNFLLDTAGITEVIINTVALNFILSIDELLFESLTAPETRCLMEGLEGCNLLESDRRYYGVEQETINETMEREVYNLSRFSLKFALPVRLMIVCLLTFTFIAEYYVTNCTKGEEGTWISQPLYMPAGVDYPLWAFLFPWMNPPRASEIPVWTMPKLTRNNGNFSGR